MHSIYNHVKSGILFALVSLPIFIYESNHRLQKALAIIYVHNPTEWPLLHGLRVPTEAGWLYWFVII